MAQLSINTVNPTPDQAYELAKQEHFVNVLLRNYLNGTENVFRTLLAEYEDTLRDMLKGDNLPSPIDVEFIRRAGREDYALGHEGRAMYQNVYDYVQELSS